MTSELLPRSSRPSLVSGETVWNIAYGSNLSVDKLTSRSPGGRRAIQPLRQMPVTVPGFRLRFDLRVLPPLEPVMANAERSDAGPLLHAVAYELTREDYDSLCLSERCSLVEFPTYVETVVRAVPYGGGEAFEGTVFTLAPPEVFAPRESEKLEALEELYLVPSLRYMTFIRDGARHAGLEKGYVGWLDELPVCSVPRWGVSKGISMLGLLGVFYLYASNGWVSKFFMAWKTMPVRVVCSLFVQREEAIGRKQPFYAALFHVGLMVCMLPFAILGVFKLLFISIDLLIEK